MKLLAGIISIIVLFCSSGVVEAASKKPKNIGNGVYYLNQKSVLWLANRNHDSNSINDKLKKHLLISSNIVKKNKRKYKINKLSALKNSGKGFKITSFYFNETNDDYYIGGKVFYKNGYTWDIISFYSVYDTENYVLKEIYAKHNSHFVGISNNGQCIRFNKGKSEIFVNRNTKTTILSKLPEGKYFSKNQVLSPKGDYFAAAITNNPRKVQNIALFDTKTGDLIKSIGLRYNDLKADGYEFQFSNNEELFIFKEPMEQFRVYDLKTLEIISTFGDRKKVKYQKNKILSTGKYIIGRVFEHDEKYKIKTSSYLYDTENRHLVGKVDVDSSILSFVDKKNNTLNIIDMYEHYIYFIDDTGLIELKKISRKFSKKERREMLDFPSCIVDNKIYVFIDGKIKKIEYDKIDFTEADITAAKNMHRIKKYIGVGFNKKGMKELKNLILNDPYDYIDKHFRSMLTFLNSSQESLVCVLGVKRYIKEGHSIDEEVFQSLIRLYILLSSNGGFIEFSLPMINEYEKLIEANPTKYHKDMISLYKANYLLETGRDDEGYELLFDASPLHKDAKKFVEKYSKWLYGLSKNIKKLSVATDVKEKHLGRKKRTILGIFYDIDGNEINRTKGKKTEHSKPIKKGGQLLE